MLRCTKFDRRSCQTNDGSMGSNSDDPDAEAGPAWPRRNRDKALVRNWRRPIGLTQRQQVEIMPRYFFNTRFGDELVADPDGEELRDPDRAWEVARAMVEELLRSERAEELLRAVLEVTDDAGEIVLEFPLAEALLDISDVPVTKH